MAFLENDAGSVVVANDGVPLDTKFQDLVASGIYRP